MDCPLWGQDCNNWAAEILKPEPSQAGGYGKRFIPKAKTGSGLYQATSLYPLMPIVFAADETQKGNSGKRRTFGVILSITDHEMVLEACGSFNHAWNKAQLLQEEAKQRSVQEQEVKALTATIYIPTSYNIITLPGETLQEVCLIDPSQDPPEQVILNLPTSVLKFIKGFKA